MSQPGSGVLQRPELRHWLDAALLVGYNVMSLLWRKKTPIPARTRWHALHRVLSRLAFVSLRFPSPACWVRHT